MVGFVATPLWIPLLGFLWATATGANGPVFGKDASFYLLTLPWYDTVVGLISTILVITIALWAVIGLANYPREGRPWNGPPPYYFEGSGSVPLLIGFRGDARNGLAELAAPGNAAGGVFLGCDGCGSLSGSLPPRHR